MKIYMTILSAPCPYIWLFLSFYFKQYSFNKANCFFHIYLKYELIKFQYFLAINSINIMHNIRLSNVIISIVIMNFLHQLLLFSCILSVYLCCSFPFICIYLCSLIILSRKKVPKQVTNTKKFLYWNIDFFGFLCD